MRRDDIAELPPPAGKQCTRHVITHYNYYKHIYVVRQSVPIMENISIYILSCNAPATVTSIKNKIFCCALNSNLSIQSPAC